MNGYDKLIEMERGDTATTLFLVVRGYQRRSGWYSQESKHSVGEASRRNELNQLKRE